MRILPWALPALVLCLSSALSAATCPSAATCATPCAKALVAVDSAAAPACAVPRVLVAKAPRVIGNANALTAASAPASCAAGACTGSCAQKRWGLAFGVGPDFTLTEGSGATISLIRQLDPRKRVSLGLTVAVSTENGDGSSSREYTYYSYEDTSRTVGDGNDDADNADISLSAQYQWLSRPHSRLRLIGGIGPILGFVHELDNSSFIEVQNDTLTYRNRQSSEQTVWSLGLRSSLGMEWRLTEALSLQASYSLSFARTWIEEMETYRYRRDPDNYYRVEDEKQKSSSWRLYSPAVKLSLIVLL